MIRFLVAARLGLWQTCLYRSEGTGRGTTHTGSIGLARWKLDRFVSVDGPGEDGTLTTIPILFSGDRLEINATTRERGHITVEVLDAAERPLEGWGRSSAFSGDSLRATLNWPHQKQLSELQGKPISLRFRLESAQLFSFAFRSS